MSTITGSTSRTCYKSRRANILALILKNMDSNMDSVKMILPQFNPATLSVGTTGVWRICWYNFHPEKQQLLRVRSTFGLNRIKDIEERKRVAIGLIVHINAALKQGYNEFLTPEQNTLAVANVDLLQTKADVQPEITMLAALEAALKIRVLGKAKRTADSYRSNVNTFIAWLKIEALDTLPVKDFTADMFQAYQFYKAGLGHKNENINEHLSFFKTTFNIIRKNLKHIKDNPIADMDYLPEHESTLFEPLTDEEIQRIVPALLEYNPRFYLFTRFIPHQFIRPHHIARLKASDIAYGKEYIAVGDGTTKNRKSRHKQLLQPIKSMLEEMGYKSLPGHYYLFGKNFEPSPDLYPTLSIRAAEIWKEIVIDGLGINKKMYALKHTSSQFFVNENDNADLKFLQQQMEHHSIAQTEIYLQNKVYKKIDEGKTKTMQY